MYSLQLFCSPDDVESLSTRLWEFGTAGIREIDGPDLIALIAGFETNEHRTELLREFASYKPDWRQEDATDWVQQTRDAWPPREVGERLFLAPPWASESTPAGRVRVVHNPGLACGTGEHPCTQLALIALERSVITGCTVVDIGSGSGMLAIAALQLGARTAVGTDLDIAALASARDNFELNQLKPAVVAGSADCLRDQCADVTVANISATVLLAVMDDLMRVTKRNGRLILTGFPEWELDPVQDLFNHRAVSAINEWRCVTATLS